MPGLAGTIFPIQSVENAIKEYPLDESIITSQYHNRYIDVDPGFSNSKFATVVVQRVDSEMRLVHSEAIERPVYSDVLAHVNSLIARFRGCKVFLDGSASHICHELKHQYGEYQAYEKLKPEIVNRFKYSEW